MQAAQQQPSGEASATDAQFSHLMSAGFDAYTDANFAVAASNFGRAAALRPDSEHAQYWAGQALVYGRRPAAAIPYLEQASKQDPDSLALHLAMVSAYAGANRPAERDRERELLRRWHEDGSHPGLAQRQTFLVETFYVQGWHVNVQEFFSPSNSQGVVWQFLVRDPAEAIEMTYALREPARATAVGASGAGRSGGANGASVGYELVRHRSSSGPARRMRTYASLPSYEVVKDEVARQLRFVHPPG